MCDGGWISGGGDMIFGMCVAMGPKGAMGPKVGCVGLFLGDFKVRFA